LTAAAFPAVFIFFALAAEAIFAELNAYHSDLIEYAYRKRVWITSPTTLMSTLTVIQMIISRIASRCLEYNWHNN
jgi:DNA anti-recombination protein RmuC